MKDGNIVGHFLESKGPQLRGRNIGLLCNQVSFDFDSRQYLFTAIRSYGKLKRIFAPEHGLFGELQDQVPLNNVSPYKTITDGMDVVSLYGDSEESLTTSRENLADIDLMIVDLQDIGARYYTYATTLLYLFRLISESKMDIDVWIIDRPNPAGRRVEGSPLSARYESFVGVEGMLHRHGMTLGEMATRHLSRSGFNLCLKIIRYPQQLNESAQVSSAGLLEIPPSPNIPNSLAPILYSGQCLLEGTNLSEGRGTTRPFELFGAPFLRNDYLDSFPMEVYGAFLRPVHFVPAFQKHQGKLCRGFQVHLTTDARHYHSLQHSLAMIRRVRELHPEEFRWRTEAYEFRDDRPAIELLAGDEQIIKYLHGDLEEEDLHAHFRMMEKAWIEENTSFLLYPEPLFQS